MTDIIAHRGYSAKYSENTMLAFKEANKFSIAGIELDVHQTLDNQLVICHDETINRTSNGTGWIKDMTLNELEQYSFYGKFKEYKDHPDCKIPTLDEFLDWAQDFEFLINIELKTDQIEYVGIEQQVIDLVNKYHLQDRIILSSFNHYSVLRALDVDHSISLGFLNDTGILDPGDYCTKYNVSQYHPSHHSLNPEAIDNCQSQNISINVYTVNDPEIMLELQAANITRIFTDEVELAIQTYQGN
ncbi:glycerophosphodiester phosphodiesterase [Aerococcaceae bacterium DSM 111022]|nr:glycerophosphodiester phosphodiesterase [Aerococcaceae bacterium DSM 111022]